MYRGGPSLVRTVLRTQFPANMNKYGEICSFCPENQSTDTPIPLNRFRLFDLMFNLRSNSKRNYHSRIREKYFPYTGLPGRPTTGIPGLDGLIASMICLKGTSMNSPAQSSAFLRAGYCRKLSTCTFYSFRVLGQFNMPIQLGRLWTAID